MYHKEIYLIDTKCTLSIYFFELSDKFIKKETRKKKS